MTNIRSILLIFFIVWSCTPEEIVVTNKDLIFENSSRILIPSYEFQDNEGKIFLMRGDTSFNSSYPDTVNSLPLLAWDSIGIKIITTAIFTEEIQVSGSRIINTNDIIWQWHSGMEHGQEGRVQYSDGRNVINDTLDYANQPDSLNEGHYYWAVWGWGESGTRILYSSRELEFYVTK